MFTKPTLTIISLLIIMMFIRSTIVRAQDRPVELMNSKQFTLHSKEVNDDYEIYVSLPLGYNQSDTTYRTLYVLDANVTFGMAHNIQTLISFEPGNPPLIIIGIAYANFGDWVQRRARDYMPTAVHGVAGSGGGQQYLNFLGKELIPHINQAFKTNEHRIIYGHSTAGLFGLYSLFTQPSLFDGYILTSPSVDEDAGHSMRLLSQSRAKSDNKKNLFVSIGTKENESFQKSFEGFMERLKLNMPPNLKLDFQQIDASHMSSMAPAFIKGLQFVNKID